MDMYRDHCLKMDPLQFGQVFNSQFDELIQEIQEKFVRFPHNTRIRFTFPQSKFGLCCP